MAELVEGEVLGGAATYHPTQSVEGVMADFGGVTILVALVDARLACARAGR